MQPAQAGQRRGGAGIPPHQLHIHAPEEPVPRRDRQDGHDAEGEAGEWPACQQEGSRGNACGGSNQPEMDVKSPRSSHVTTGSLSGRNRKVGVAARKYSMGRNMTIVVSSVS